MAAEHAFSETGRAGARRPAGLELSVDEEVHDRSVRPQEDAVILSAVAGRDVSKTDRTDTVNHSYY